jgi:hypothetical protein
MHCSSLVGIVFLALAACASARRPAAPALPAGAEAVVTRDAFVIAFPPVAPGDTAAWPAPTAPRWPGYYDWRFGIRPSLVASFGVSGQDAGRAAAAHGSLGAVVAASRLRRCDGAGTHMLVCAVSLAGEGHVEGGADGRQRVVVAVRDSTLLAALRAERPAYAWRSVWRPGGLAVSPDSVRILYPDQ